MKIAVLIFFQFLSQHCFAQEQLCEKIDTLIATNEGRVFLKLEGIKRSFYTLKDHHDSSLISILSTSKAHGLKVCIEGFGKLEEGNHQSFTTVRLN